MDEILSFDIERAEDDIDYFHNRSIVSMFYIVSSVLVSIIGIIGSLGICGIKLRKLKELKATDILIMNFSVGILLRSFIIILVLINDYNGTSHLWICYFRHFMLHLCPEVEMKSILALIIVSKYFSKMSARNGIKILIAIWTFGMFCGYPYINYGVSEFTTRNRRHVNYCYFNESEFCSLELRLVIIGYIVPLIGLFVAIVSFKYMKRFMNFTFDKNLYIYAIFMLILCYLVLINEMMLVLICYSMLSLSFKVMVLVGYVQVFVIVGNPIALYLFDAKFKREVYWFLKGFSCKNDAARLEEDENELA